MLIHGRLVVTRNGFMLDEVKSLLQKSLRRQEHHLAFQAAKELVSGPRDQLKWHNIVTFMFEDHCLNHVDTLEELYNHFQKNHKFGAIELISKCYTCRLSACLQVVAINDEHRKYEQFWESEIKDGEEIVGLVTQKWKGINCDQLLANIVKKWRERDIEALISLFGLVNMAAKVEGRNVTAKGMGMLIDRSVKKPTLYHLVVSILYKYTVDEYMKRILLTTFRFATIPDTPQGLILFTVLSQLKYKSTILAKPIPNIATRDVNWGEIKTLTVMPSWAVDKHTYRGKFGKASKDLFLKKFKDIELSEDELNEFHGERPKADIRTFFDVGCVCSNEILEENPYWEDAKAVYLKQKPSLQKCAKMTKLYYQQLTEENSVVVNLASDQGSEESQTSTTPEKNKKNKKRTSQNDIADVLTKRSKHTPREEKPTGECSHVRSPTGPLLQLPTGSGKVYTRLDLRTMKVYKGPYRSTARQQLCVFFHRAMKEVFNDLHTMEVTEEGEYLVFDLLKSEDNIMKTERRAFYDAIAKRQVPEEEGEFIDRHSLGITQLHKLSPEIVANLPMSVWVHFGWRYVLNVGDTGLYNAIATDDLTRIYGIDMEESRKQVKGNNVMNMLFGKMPRKEMLAAIQEQVR